MTSRSRRAAFAAAAGAAASDGPTGLIARLMALPRLVVDVVAGRYAGVSRSRLLLMGLAFAYIVSPIDLLPEALLTIPGLADDALVAGWLVTALLAATSGYQAWRAGTAGPAPAPGAPPSAPASGTRVVPGEVLSSRPA